MPQNEAFLPIEPGERITAEWLNKVGLQAFRQVSGQDCIVNGAGTFFRPDLPANGLLFKNDTEETIPAYGVIRLDGLATAGNAKVLSAKKPNTYGSQYSHYINGPKIVEAGKLGRCFEPFHVPAVYDDADGTPAFGEMWGPRSGTWELKKNTGGFRVIGVTDSTNKLVLVQQAPMLTVRGKTGGTVSAGSNATLTAWTGAFGSESEQASQTIASVQNDSLCDIDGTEICTAQWVPDNGGWQFVIFEFV